MRERERKRKKERKRAGIVGRLVLNWTMTHALVLLLFGLKWEREAEEEEREEEKRGRIR